MTNTKQDSIETIYKRANEWAEELWGVSKAIKVAESHASDRMRSNQALLDAFDAAWSTHNRTGKPSREEVVLSLLHWWIDLGNLACDCKPLIGGDHKASGIRFEPRYPKGDKPLDLWAMGF